jgi:putative RecB family exonuclease
MKTKLRLSPSRASDFKTCPQLYKFRAVDRLHEPPSQAQLRGTIVHKALELLVKMPPEDRSRAAASQCLETALAVHREGIGELVDLLASRDESSPNGDMQVDADNGESRLTRQDISDVIQRLRSDGEALLDNYFKLEDPASVEAIATERWVRAPLVEESDAEIGTDKPDLQEGTELIGVIDRIERTASGDLIITDYKTGQSPAKNFERDAFFGLRFYSLILSKANWSGELPSRLRLIYLQDAQVLEDTVTQPVISSTLKLVSAIAQAIIRAERDNDWRPNPGRLCDYCHFKPICPAHTRD